MRNTGARVDFLLECIGFPPDHPLEDIVQCVLRDGEPAAWRGDPARHRRLVLGGGLELRMDREDDRLAWNLLPFFQTPHRLRIAVDEIRALPDSPFDALLWGWVAPPVEEAERRWSPGAYRLALNLMDARKLPRTVAKGHVLAVAAAGFALDLAQVGPLAPGQEARIEPLGHPEDPGGCAEISLAVREIRHLKNPITGIAVELLELDAPERPQVVFTSRWQRERDGLAPPQVGGRIDGTFLFLGTITGGLPGQARAGRRAFG
jgi:hypothetical protein